MHGLHALYKAGLPIASTKVCISGSDGLNYGHRILVFTDGNNEMSKTTTVIVYEKIMTNRIRIMCDPFL